MTITLFAAVSQGTGQQLDDNLTAVSNQAPIPCTASGSNSIALTPKSNIYAVTAYTNNMQLSGVAASTNTTATTAQLGSLGALNVYKDTTSGPIALTGGEFIAGCAFTLLYDSALNSGAGGFHLFSGTQGIGTTISPNFIQLNALRFQGPPAGATMSRYFSGTASVSFSIFGPASSQESIVALTGVLPNDNVLVGPPSMTNQALSFFGYVSASGSVAIRAVNAASVSVTLAAGIFRVSGIA